MANITIKRVCDLDTGLILAPERYDIRRSALGGGAGKGPTISLGQLVEIIRQTINPNSLKAVGRKFIVLDTSDIREGLIVGRKKPVFGPDIGSTKKVFLRNDVLISRLRPYLRQVAIVDNEFASKFGDAELACSTEFFILRSKSEEPIDFLVPYLLSDPVQKVLAASQEGGHHPRFDDSVLLALPVPLALVQHRKTSSDAIALAAAQYRKSESIIQECLENANRLVAASQESVF